MVRQRPPRSVALASWICVAAAGIQAVAAARVSRYGFDRVAVVILSDVAVGVALLCAGLGLKRGRRWAWILGVGLGLLHTYAGAMFLQAWLSEFDHGPLFVPFILTAGVGGAVLVCSFTPAALRFFWRRTAGREFPLTTALVPGV